MAATPTALIWVPLAQHLLGRPRPETVTLDGGLVGVRGARHDNHLSSQLALLVEFDPAGARSLLDVIVLGAADTVPLGWTFACYVPLVGAVYVSPTSGRPHQPDLHRVCPTCRAWLVWGHFPGCTAPRQPGEYVRHNPDPDS